MAEPGTPGQTCRTDGSINGSALNGGDGGSRVATAETSSALNAAVIADIVTVGIQTGQDLLAEMITHYREHSLDQFSVIGKEIDAGNAEEGARAAHALRSASATMGVALVSDACARVERHARLGQLDEAAALLPSVAAALHTAHLELEALLTKEKAA